METLELTNQTKEIDLKFYKEIKLKCLEYEGEIPSYTVIYLNGIQNKFTLSNPDQENIINTNGVATVKVTCEHGKCKIQLETS